jgi:hypothetical protein
MIGTARSAWFNESVDEVRTTNLIKTAQRYGFKHGWWAGFYSGVCAVVVVAFIVFLFWEALR